MLDVLEHLPNPEAALRQAVELLAPGGILLVTVPAFMALWTRHDDLNHHYTRYTQRTLGMLAAAAGVQVSEMRYFFRWPAPAKLAVRLMEALVPGVPVPPTLPPRPLNWLLYTLSRLEERLLARAPIPFGTSVLAIGRRRDA
jgi:SAM-dependent methyltransferase